VFSVICNKKFFAMSTPPKTQTDQKKDPGWNDPPMLNYSSTNPPPKTRITNKRIAFPVTGTSTTNSSNTNNQNNTPNVGAFQGPPKN
jgi:hypothetical protein